MVDDNDDEEEVVKCTERETFIRPAPAAVLFAQIDRWSSG
jgi:hypothetical protein